MPTLKFRDPMSGQWQEIAGYGPPGPDGPEGPTGPTGPMGVSSVIVGDFGVQTTPASLPPTGLIPVNWDGPGNPAVAFQMELGQSLYFDKPGDPLDGHLFQFVSTAIDPAGWLDIGLIQGPAGADGVAGPTGPAGAQGITGPVGPPLPNGGAAGAVLRKKTTTDQDVAWTGNIVLANGEIIQFPNQADVPKLHLYSTTFGLGITSGTLNLFASSTIKFNQNSISGTEWAHIDAAGLGPYSTSNVTWQNGFSGTADLHKNPAGVWLRLAHVHRNVDTNHNTQTKLFDLPAGFPAPPGVTSQGWRTPISFRASDFSADYQRGVIHVDATSVWVIVIGSKVGSGGYFDCTMSWPRVS